MFAPEEFYPHRGHLVRVVFDTSDPDQARSLRVLKEADASGSFGPDGFQCQQRGPELYAVAFRPGWDKELLDHKAPQSAAREATP
jgi:hypothetical protein